MSGPDGSVLVEVLSLVLPRLAPVLEGSTSIHLAVLCRDGTVRWANRALAKSVDADPGAVAGQPVAAFLTAASATLMTRYLSGAEPVPEREFMLNLVAADQSPASLRCRLLPVGHDALLVGEPPLEANRALDEELLQLNNQLAVISRENIRKGRELAQALDELKQAQAMLVHQEKMASLGQMTAGIAHEINNPIAYVLNNEHLLRRDCGDLLTVITALEGLLPQMAALAPPLHDALMDKAAEVDLGYLMEAMPRKIAANIEGLERIKEIVLDLRNFSRLDEAERKPCHLSTGIEASLRFLGPLMKERGVTVETDFAELPQVLCSPGPLNQAISNILTNAIQASRAGQTVRACTREADVWYVIEVTDRGVGIPAEHLGKVFDPFFTTKPVGSGTGLGLSIAHQVVAAHQGRIEIDSTPGAGTTVRILLPRAPSACMGREPA